jgi:hypothetical protein
MDLWPRRFNVFMSARRVQHNDVKAWVQRYTPPVCALMPDKLSDPAANAVNQANFSNLCRMLLENQMVSPELPKRLSRDMVALIHHDCVCV